MALGFCRDSDPPEVKRQAVERLREAVRKASGGGELSAGTTAWKLHLCTPQFAAGCEFFLARSRECPRLGGGQQPPQEDRCPPPLDGPRLRFNPKLKPRNRPNH